MSTVVSQLDAKIYASLRDRLLTLPGGYTLVDQSETYPTEADTPFILVQDVRFEPASRYLRGENENRGLFSLAVMTPLEWTHFQTLTIAGLIREHFPKSAKYTKDDVTVEILETPSYVGNAYRDKSFNRLPVNIRWRCTG